LRHRLRSPEAKIREKKDRWERNWRVEGERPVEQLATTVPKELKDAVAEGWIVPGSTVMDIGSGRGQISAWLAERGFTVLGVDLADSATELARHHFSDVGAHLQFRTLDICRDPAEPGRFDAFVDRGCFQGVPVRARYVENVLTWSKPNARLLLFHRVDVRDVGTAAKETLEKRLEELVRRSFEPHFEIQRAGPTAELMARSAGPIPRIVRPGLVFWMTRR
jgi:cyclopropane fatty-acyl-phospholipid synthase-like methyltransferase